MVALMPLRTVPRTIFDNRENTESLDFIVNALTDITNKLILDGVLVTGILVGVAAIEIAHGLGRDWVGRIIVEQDSSAIIWDTDQTDRSRFVTLIASAPANISLWVF
jgi:hypothetical protein